MTKTDIKTVGELKEVLEKLDPDMGLDLFLTCYKGRNFCITKKYYCLDKLKNGVSINVNTNDEDNTLVITNSNTEDFYIDED